jgi:hypothetical protein
MVIQFTVDFSVRFSVCELSSSIVLDKKGFIEHWGLDSNVSVL